MPHGCSSNRPPSISPNSGHEKNAVAAECAATNPFPSSLHERQEIGALLRREIDFADAEEEDRVEVVQVADVELLAGRDAGPGGKRDRVLRDQLRVGADERVVGARFAAEPFDRRDGVRDRVVLIAVADVGPREHVLARRRGGRWPSAELATGASRRTATNATRARRSRLGHFAPAGSANATIFDPGAAPRKLPPPAATTTYWRPSLPRNVIGTVCAHAVELGFPQLLAGPRLEGAEAAVDRRADEDQAAGGRDAAADVERAGLVESLRLERLDESERHLPRDLAAVHVDARPVRRTAAPSTESSSRDSRIGRPRRPTGCGAPRSADRRRAPCPAPSSRPGRCSSRW